MDYTKNYHLPQWKKEDRIMMEDFNAAMADIETGLGQASKKADDIAQAAAPLESMYGGLFRAAYNHASLLMEKKQHPRQSGALYRSFDAEAGSELPENTVQRPHCAWVSNTGPALNMDNIRASMKKISDISVKNNCNSLVLTFTASGSGWLTGIRMYGHISNSSGSPGDCTIRLTDLGTGKAEEQRDSFHFPAAYNETTPRSVKANFTLKGGQKYRLEVILDDLRANPDLEFSTASGDGLLLIGAQAESLSIPWVLPLEESALGGLALVRCQFQGTAGNLRLNWAGQALTPHRLRTVTTGDGKALLEAEFRRSTPLDAGNCSLTFTITCPKGSDLELYAMGAAAI